jgi:hypothetical protein
VYFGLEYPEAPDVTALTHYETELGAGAALVLWYQDWIEGGALQHFPVGQMDAIRQHGSIPVLAWYPADEAAGGVPTQPDFSLDTIISGKWDAYVRMYAAEVKAWGHPFFLRFASEMNGNWTPWSEMTNGNRAGQYAQAWRHIHDIFTQVGARNATWTWCPNVELPTYTPLEDLYPGNGYVDWACLDGYNYGSDYAGVAWRTFSQIFSATYAHLLKVIPADMPVLIGETASVEDGGSKADWITDALTVQIPTFFPRVKGFIWFNATNPPKIDLRIDTSPAALAALHQALATGTYAANVYRFLDQSPVPVPAGVVPVPSRPVVVHARVGPALGTIQLVSTTDYTPVASATLLLGGGAAATVKPVDAHGSATLPATQPPTTLEQIMLAGGTIPAGIAVDPRFGYQVSVDLETGQVTRVLVHDPPGAPPLVQLSLTPSLPWKVIELQGTMTALLLIVTLYTLAAGLRARRR